MSTPGGSASPEPGGQQLYLPFGSASPAAPQSHHSHSTTPQRQQGHLSAVETSPTDSRQFTAAMRDRQARGKDPYGEDTYGNSMYMNATYGDQNFSVEERRAYAAQVLDSPELIMMHAHNARDSIANTRLRFTRMMCGYEEKPEPSDVEVRDMKKVAAKRQAAAKRRSQQGYQSLPFEP